MSSINVDANNAVYDSRNNCNAIVETSTNKLISGCKNSTIPYGISSISDYAFYGCNGLETVVLPESVTNIGKNAFIQNIFQAYATLASSFWASFNNIVHK